jgi:hypothetical protein
MIISNVKGLSKGSEKIVELKCDLCGKITHTTYSNFYRCQQKNNFTGKTKCKTCSNKKNGELKRGRGAWNKGIKKPDEERYGKSYINHDGYKMIYIYNPRAKCKWEHFKKEHVFIIETFIGRKLYKHEVVHHINGNKLDNRLENLVILNKHSHHRKAHLSLQIIGYKLVEYKLLDFDRNTNTYVANVKLRELLEHLEKDNQQPSSENDIKVSEKVQRLGNEESTNNLPTSAEQVLPDDIV